jgi:predicted ThiF/HesA family dinucleotide-utilizing enzyme
MKVTSGVGDDSFYNTRGIHVYSVIVIEGSRVSPACSTVVFAEECASVEGNISSSGVFSISEDIAIIESEDGASFYVACG